MKCTLLTTLLATLAVSSLAAPFDLGDLFSGFQPLEKQEVVKRQVQANPDAELKQISFHGLIGDLEDSLFQSALSLHQASAPGSEVEEVKPESQAAIADDEDHALTKRSDESTPATDAAATSTDDGLARKILLQTTRKVPNSEDGVPAHLVIDHVSVQPHNGGALSLIPTFQVHHTKLISATIKEDSSSDSSDGKQTKISITKTSITSTAPIESVEEAVAIAGSLATTEEASTKTDAVTTTKVAEEVTTTTTVAEKEETTTAKAAEKEEAEKSSTTILTIVGSSTTSTSTSTTSTTTTEEPIEKLKKDEEKLKEKVAEVEADPVILSARV
ncbi:serine-rich adhesin for platelets [Drosophila subpulchrella]|uniref:serine-rich adhesin for platelets n=1 Tax=Drosophila subpulchrella TaxID=1486046 RepID=UPI0018A16556|nr:serine-rich adhesin for platelets [Drosophila subpulchrella]